MSVSPRIDTLLYQMGEQSAISTPRQTLTLADRNEMQALLNKHFEGVTDDQFARDLDEKTVVLRVFKKHRLVGFTTLQSYVSEQEGQRINVIYSGDTIMAPEAWNSAVLAAGWLALVFSLRRSRPKEDWYWLLLSSGYRTYRFLPVFTLDYAPRYNSVPGTRTACLLTTLARERFGTDFDDSSGIVRFKKPQLLRSHLASVPPGKKSDPHVAFFLQKNPGHYAGDELACLTEISEKNLSRVGRRMLRRVGL